ncbi:sensor histidine kinase [Methylobacterium iners]|uniref:histidine kinase n=1 Tax=Methylobacterium iners TaxID=418707 RepID=A0ABQ4RZR2_9HYPH|nr:HAMP domain-containing sensor histidine kinase [Methylobacterium iners]GJD95052.1 Adaptive-response sensory-kinase SasA [Methylobacterium iners]
MRVGRKIALVGGVPILIAAAIAVAGWFLLAQAERARDGTLVASQVYHDLSSARLIRDAYVAANPSERAAHADTFATLTARASKGLGALSGLARTREQTSGIASARGALAGYVERMNHLIRLTRESDGLTAEMAQRADTLITLADRARLRQQASNADLVRSLSEKVNKLRATRDIVANLNLLRTILAEIAVARVRAAAPAEPSPAAGRPQSDIALLQNASRSLSAALRGEGRAREADELEALSAGQGLDEATPDRTGASQPAVLAAWSERLLKIDTSGQRTLHDEVAQLLTYSIEANETQQATQDVAITTLKLGQRTADALARRDTVTAASMVGEGERLSAKTAALPISPLIQGEMIDAIDGWRTRLATTIDGLKRQGAMLAEMDSVAAVVSESARTLNDAFVGDADRLGSFLRQILLFGAAGGLLLGSLAALAVARSITVPLRQLQDDMIALAADPSAGTVIGTQRRDELGEIARATNFFVTEIGRRERALRRAKDQADAALVELKQVQDDLIRAEKLASLGQLVAGVAHEINTPLGIALTTATIVRDETRDFQALVAQNALSRSRLTHYVDRVGEGAALLYANLARAADLVHGFKQVAVDRAADEHRTFAIDAWLDDLLASLQPMLRKGGHVVRHECSAGLTVNTNPGALAQVVTNLITNAVVHGFGGVRGGQIVVRVAHAAPGFVRLDVVDDGRGIAAENLPRIFDPFFTTARARGSTGLGMHIVHNLVTATLKGRIAVESQPGSGTVISVEFASDARGAPTMLGPARQHADVGSA